MIAPGQAAPSNYRVITFYSYKGGVGRSMALANVAALLAQMGRRVLAVDFDLEAPGLARYFEKDEASLVQPKGDAPGLVDLFIAHQQGRPLSWKDCVVNVRVRTASVPISFIPAGRKGPDYAERVQSLNWDLLFKEHALGDYLAELREEWRDAFDMVLIDSRTGMSDVGGICTILLPDALVMLFTANSQSIEGTAEVVRRARAAQETLPVERSRLLAIPMLSRDDRRTEYEQSERWRTTIATAMGEFFDDWVLKGVPVEAVLQRLYLPQVAYWSFGERMPVIERPTELNDPGTLGAAYWRLACLINADLNWEGIADYQRPTSQRDLPSYATSSQIESIRGDSAKTSTSSLLGDSPITRIVMGVSAILASVSLLILLFFWLTPILRSNRVDGTANVIQAPPPANSVQSAPPPATPSFRIYIEVQRESQVTPAEAVAQTLNDSGGGRIEVVSVELLTSPTSHTSHTEIRCSNKNCKDAPKLASLVSEILGREPVLVRDVSNLPSSSMVQAGSYELWFGPGAIPAPHAVAPYSRNNPIAHRVP